MISIKKSKLGTFVKQSIIWRQFKRAFKSSAIFVCNVAGTIPKWWQIYKLNFFLVIYVSYGYKIIQNGTLRMNKKKIF